MTLFQLTPWARRAMTDELRSAIEGAQPAELLVTLGRGTAGWTCRILSPRREGVMGEAYGAGTMESAFRQAQEAITR